MNTSNPIPYIFYRADWCSDDAVDL